MKRAFLMAFAVHLAQVGNTREKVEEIRLDGSSLEVTVPALSTFGWSGMISPGSVCCAASRNAAIAQQLMEGDMAGYSGTPVETCHHFSA